MASCTWLREAIYERCDVFARCIVLDNRRIYTDHCVNCSILVSLTNAATPAQKGRSLFVHVMGLNPFDQPAVVASENIKTRKPHASRKSVYMSDCAGWTTRARRLQCALRWFIGLSRFKRHIALLTLTSTRPAPGEQ